MDNMQQFQEKYLSEIEAVIVRFLEGIQVIKR